MSKTTTDKAYWKRSTIVFFAIFIEYGLRFGRGIDWNNLCMDYTQPNYWATGTEPVWELVFNTFKFLNVPFFIFVCVWDLFFIYSFLLFCKNFRNCLHYVFLLIPIIAVQLDNYISWFAGLSFVFIALYFLTTNSRRKYYCSLLFFFLAACTHNGLFALVVFVVFFKFLNKKIISPYISAGFVVFSITSISVSSLTFFSDVMQQLYYGIPWLKNFDNSIYLLNMGMRINGELGFGVHSASKLGMLLSIMMYIPVILFAPKYIQKYQYGIACYNIFVVGAFIHPFFSQIEILDRYSISFLLFQCIVGGITFYKVIYASSVYRWRKITMIICILATSYSFFTYTFRMKSDLRMMYVWEAGGQQYINPALYLNETLKSNKQ